MMTSDIGEQYWDAAFSQHILSFNWAGMNEQVPAPYVKHNPPLQTDRLLSCKEVSGPGTLNAAKNPLFKGRKDEVTFQHHRKAKMVHTPEGLWGEQQHFASKMPGIAKETQIPHISHPKHTFVTVFCPKINVCSAHRHCFLPKVWLC